MFWKYSMLVFHTYWSGAGDISQDEVMARIAAEAGLEPAAFAEFIATDEAKDAVSTSLQCCASSGRLIASTESTARATESTALH